MDDTYLVQGFAERLSERLGDLQRAIHAAAVPLSRICPSRLWPSTYSITM